MCGGTLGGLLQSMLYGGLSPRVRGNLSGAAGIKYRQRSIPACAGEPEPGAGKSVIAKVYPRVCGGTSGAGIVSVTASGLSPRVRGNLLDDRRPKSLVGSIPACAGEPAT